MTLDGISGMAVVRAADSMLRALGGTEISVMFPLLTLPNDPSAQLGLVDPGVEEVAFSPVVVRILETASTGPRRRLEFLISGATVADELSSRNVATAEALFATALGVLYQGDLLHIENVTTEYFADAAYLCRVLAVE
jgi:hypothetical protein